MNVDKDGSYLREPSVSEGELKARIEALAADTPFNDSTVLERSLTLESDVASIDMLRAKKELEASLGHQIDNRLSVSMRYNPNWQTFDVREVRFALPGTISLTANASYDPGSDTFSSYLYDSVTEQQIARGPIQTSTIGTLLQSDGIHATFSASNHTELMANLYQTASPDMSVTIHQLTTLIDEEVTEDLHSTYSIERTQTFSDDDILDVIEFVETIDQPTVSHARVISVLTSQNGSTITAEQVTHNHATEENTHQQIEFDYETLEKLLKHVDKARNRLNKD